MEEEHKWQEATNHVLCANNCGFFGSPTTLNLCSKCYNDHRLKERQMSTARIAVENSLTHSTHQSESSPSASASAAAAAAPSAAVFLDRSISEPAELDLAPPSTAAKPQQRNRCGSCRKRVGLTGFTCRCGTTFCGAHRYPEEHECSFDFKTVGKEAIARENPVVKAAKLEKI